MNRIVFIWFLVLGFGICFAEGQRSGPANRSNTAISLRARSEMVNASITFLSATDGAPVLNVGLGEGILNLGSLSYVAQANEPGVHTEMHKDSFVVSTKVGLRVDVTNSGRGGMATLSAYLLSPHPFGTVAVDGVELSITPGIIARQISYGAITEHVLKIVVPASMPAGQLVDLIGVIVTPN
jgi:hypothetical protein